MTQIQHKPFYLSVCSSAQQQKQTDKVNKHLGYTTCPDHPLKSPDSACTVPLQQKCCGFKIQLDFCKRQRSKTTTRSHLWVLPKRRAHWARRGHWHRTCWRSALESSSASPWPGRTLGTVESSPACPDWPAPSCSSLPGTDSGTAEIISKKAPSNRSQGHLHYSASIKYAQLFNLHESEGLPSLPKASPITHLNFVQESLRL